MLIIGASDGIGKEIAKLYAKRKSKLFLVARRQSLLEHVASECTVLGSNSVNYLSVDVTVESNIKHLREEVLRSTACVDVLVLCVGVLGVKLFGELSPSEACLVSNKIMSVNVLVMYQDK